MEKVLNETTSENNKNEINSSSNINKSNNNELTRIPLSEEAIKQNVLTSLNNLLDLNKTALKSKILIPKSDFSSIEENLKSDPDFVKSYDNSKKKAAAKGEKFVPMNEREIVAMIAYIQRLGTDIKVKKQL